MSSSILPAHDFCGLAADLLTQLAKELVLHLFPHGSNEPRAHRRDHPTDLAL
jgi:hypothetical protein